ARRHARVCQLCVVGGGVPDALVADAHGADVGPRAFAPSDRVPGRGRVTGAVEQDVAVDDAVLGLHGEDVRLRAVDGPVDGRAARVCHVEGVVAERVTDDGDVADGDGGPRGPEAQPDRVVVVGEVAEHSSVAAALRDGDTDVAATTDSVPGHFEAGAPVQADE